MGCISVSGAIEAAKDVVRQVDGLDEVPVAQRGDLITELTRRSDSGTLTDAYDAQTLSKLSNAGGERKSDELLDEATAAIDEGNTETIRNIRGETLYRILENNGDVSKTLKGTRVSDDTPGIEGSVVWLEEGNDAAGFQHIVNRHGNSEEFYRLSGIDQPEDIKELIMTTADKGQPQRIPPEDGGGTAFVYTHSDGNIVTVVAGENGFVVTARPGDY